MYAHAAYTLHSLIKDSKSFIDVGWAYLHKMPLPGADTVKLKKDKVLSLRSNLLTLDRNGLTCFWSRMLHRTCPRWQFQRWYMKLTAPAFDKLLHSLWIWKTELEWMLAGYSRDNFHPCTSELVGTFQSKLFCHCHEQKNIRKLLWFNFFAIVYRLAGCYFLNMHVYFVCVRIS